MTARRWISTSFCLLLAVATAPSLLPVVSAEQIEDQTCKLGEDGTCLDQQQQAEPPKVAAAATDCQNQHESCEFWASKGECDGNPKYMLKNCPVACKTCDKLEEIETLIREKLEAKEKALQAERDLQETPWGVKQVAVNDKVRKWIDNSTNYMTSMVLVDPKYDKVRSECKNRHKDCAFWASEGECDANPTYMTLQCAPSCFTCHLIDFDARCPFNETEPSIWEAGDLNKMFVRITTDEEYQRYGPKIHSMPAPPPGSNDILKGPWVVTLENLLAPEECDRLVELGGVEGYKISQDVGKKKFDGSYDGYTNDRRTSTNAWCQNNCYNDTVTQTVLKKIEHVTGIPDTHSEYLQLLKYEVGQFYATHHDYIPHHIDRQEGVRILTVFLYLNDVEEGGGTDFPSLGITVQPKKGRALLWPSVRDESPDHKDGRTNHQALPVKKGVKFGANAWIHQRDFKEVFKRGCH